MNHVVFVQKFAPSNSPPLTADFETKSASAAPILQKKMKVLLLSGGSDPPEVALPPRRGGSDPPGVALPPRRGGSDPPEVARLTGGGVIACPRAGPPPWMRSFGSLGLAQLSLAQLSLS